VRFAAGVKVTPASARKALRGVTVPVSVIRKVPAPLTVTPPPLSASKKPVSCETLSVMVTGDVPASTSAIVMPVSGVAVSSVTRGATATDISSRAGPELPPSRLRKVSVVSVPVAVNVNVWFVHPMSNWPRPALLN
jgi:hypothetical protein